MDTSKVCVTGSYVSVTRKANEEFSRLFLGFDISNSSHLSSGLLLMLVGQEARTSLCPIEIGLPIFRRPPA